MATTSTSSYYISSTSNSAWSTWTSGYSSTATTSCSSDNVWYTWTGSGTSTATTYPTIKISSNDVVWTTWSADSTAGTITVIPETAEQRTAREAEQAEFQRACVQRLKEEEAAKQLAEQKAFELLKIALSDEEVMMLETEKHIEVRGSNSKTVYRIKKGRARNVQELDENGKVKRHLCFHPVIACPDFDTMLSQKLLLETNEDEALRIANFS